MKKMLTIAVALGLGLGLFADSPLRADWMAGKRGMMVHWLFGEPGRIDYYVNAFDINKFMADFDETKSDYLIFTVGQNAGVYASPNSKITGYAGEGHCPTRDLVGEIAAAVHARGKKFIAYLPCELNANTTLHEGFGWPAAGSGKDMSTFQTRWLEVITEWAVRWGSNLDGWWIDGYTDGGTHWPDVMSAADEALWAAALRAGNANAVITFNNGLAKKTPRAGAVLSDYLAGEINSPSALNGWTLKEFADDATCRTHFLMPIDGFWGGYWSWDQAGGANPYSGLGLPNQQTMDRLSYVGQFPDPVVSESDLSAMISSVFAVHGAVTINIGVNASGTLNPASVALLAKMPGGSESASAPKGTTVESLIGSWSSTPMASDGSTFSTDGDLVYAYSTASADKTVNGITFKAAADPTSASTDFEFSPAFNTTQNAESDGMSGDLETIAKLAWKNSEKKTGGYATMTFKGLTAGRRYCIQLYIHDTYCHSSAVFGPDAKSTVIYRSEESDPKSGKDWTCGGVFTGVITAKGATHEITLRYPTTDRVELNALQVRCLGDADDDDEIVRPEDAPVAEESVIDAMAWDALFPTAKTFADTENSFDLPYRQHSPATADGVKYPLVIFLHGAGEIGSDNEKQVKTENDVIPLTKYAMKHGDAFVLAPQCPGRSGSSDYSLTWSGADWENYPMTRLETPTKPMAAVIKLITEFMANNPVDPTRVYVTGLSMGGFGTWDLASRMTTTFAAVMPCCGGADTNAVELYRGQSIRFFHGSSDLVVNPEFSRGMDTALTTAGIEHDYIEYSGTGHDACWRKAYVDTDLNLEWLFGHIKGEEYVAPDHGDTTPNAPLSDLASGGWLSWKLKSDGSAIVDRGTKVWAYAQNYSCVQGGGHYLGNLVVNGVEFTKSGSFGDMSASLSCDRTFSGKDTFGTEDLSDSASDFARMLKTGWEAVWDQGPVQTYTLHGLTGGKMYLVQFVYHCEATDRAGLSVIAPDGSTSTRVNGWDANGQNLDENWRYGGSLIGVFTATGTDQELVITYSKTANYLLNAVQLREVTVDDLTKEPEIVYGTPTIGSVTPSVSGTTATLTLANVAVGQNGGCYQVWLAYAEDGTELGDETAALISQQSASCAVEIKNLTAGKKYNYSLYVKNEGNVVSSKKTGSFTIPGGGSDPVDPPSGDDPDPAVSAIEAAAAELGVGCWLAMPLTGNPADVVTEGTLFVMSNNNKKLSGAKSPGTVNGVVFGGSWSGDGGMTSSPEVSNGKNNCTDCNVSDTAYNDILKNAFTGKSAAEHQVFTFANLTPNATYLVQYICHGQSEFPRSATVTDAQGTHSIEVSAATSSDEWYYGGTLIHVFKANSAGAYELTIDFRDSNGAVDALVNAFQVREVERSEEPEPVDPPSGEDGWTAKPMSADLHEFVTDGTVVWAKAAPSGDPGFAHVANGIDFMESQISDLASVVTVVPAFNNTKDKCGWEGLGADKDKAGTFMGRAWVCEGASNGGVMTMTVGNLTIGHRYCLQLMIHNDGDSQGGFNPGLASDTMTAPDGETTINYGGTGWQYGGTLIGTFVADAATKSFTFTHSRQNYFQMNAIQLRDLGEAGDDPEPVEADPDTSWMKGSFGVSFHWTAKIVDNYGSKNWEQAVNNFDVDEFADSVESFGAQHVIFTVAHAWQKLPCPCAALDSYISGRTTTRDLMKDIIDELTNRNIRVVFYYNHSCNHNEDSAWQEASGYNDITDEASMAAFGSKICSIVRELSLRYGDGVSAWWFDSASSVDDSEPWTGNKKSAYVNDLRFPWDNLFAAARAGNPHAAVAVNWDVGATNQHELATDYLSGETEKIDAYGNCFPFAPERLQDHIWTRMDSSDWFWQGGEVKNYGSRFSEEQLAWWKVSHRDAGRMATLNLVIDEAGNINPVVAQQLVNTKTLGKVWVQGRYDPTKWQAAPTVSNLILNVAGECAGNRSEYTDGYHRTPMTVLTDGTVPMTAIVAGANLTNDEKAKIFESLKDNVFTWTLAQASDVYGLNLYSRSSRSQYNGATDGGNDAIVVAKVEVQFEGSTDWVDINAPSLSFGKGDGVSGGALVAKLTDGSGAPLATGVTAIRFTQGETENGASLLVECEVIGCKSAPQVVDIPTAAAALLPGCWLAAPLTGDPSDFITEGTLAVISSKNMAGSRKYASDDTVQNIPFGGSSKANDHMVADPAFSANKDCGTGATCGLEGAYGDILKYGWSGATPAEYQTITFSGFDPDKTYLVQYIIHGELNVTNRYDEVADVVGTHRIWQSAATAGEEWYYGGTLIHVFRPAPDGSYVLQIAHRSVDEKSGTVSYQNGLMNAYQIREVTREIPDPPAPPPVYRLTIPAKTGLVLGSVTTNGTPVAETEGAYSIVSNTEVTITFTAASGYELDGNDGVVVKTIESDTTLADADYPAVKEQGGGEDPVDPPPGPHDPGELVNGRANMKGWAMKRISITPNGATETGFGWSAGDDPSSKSYSATESVMTFTDAQVVNTIQLFAPSSDMANMPAAFKVYGSDDGSSWSELLSVADEADWFARECRYYTFRNETAYSHYKLSVVSTVSGNAAKLGVYNYYFAKPADPTTAWTWDPNSKADGFSDNGKLWRGDQQLSAWKNGNRIQLRNNSSNVNAYDLDFSAGIVDVDGNPLSYTVYLENGIKSGKYLTRIIGAAVIDAVPSWGAQYCWYLNELSLGSAFTSFGEKQAFENAYSLQCLDLTQLSAQTLPIGTFNSAYNLKGDIVLKVKTFAASFARSRITSLVLNEVETYGDGNSYFDPFGWCDCLTNVTLGADLKDINCGRAFGKVGKDGSPAYVDIWWKGVPPAFSKSQPELFNEGANNRITHHLPWSQREAWIDFAANHGLTSFSLTLPEGLASADGVWESNSGAKSIVKWWSEEPPKPKTGTVIFIR